MMAMSVALHNAPESPILFVSGVGIRKGLGIGEKSWAKPEFHSKDVLIPCFSKVLQSKHPFSKEADMQSLTWEGFSQAALLKCVRACLSRVPGPQCGSWGGRIEPQWTRFENR